MANSSVKTKPKDHQNIFSNSCKSSASKTNERCLEERIAHFDRVGIGRIQSERFLQLLCLSNCCRCRYVCDGGRTKNSNNHLTKLFVLASKPFQTKNQRTTDTWDGQNKNRIHVQQQPMHHKVKSFECCIQRPKQNYKEQRKN